MELLERIPEQNEFIRTEHFDLTVQMADEQKIDSLIVKVRQEDKEEQADA